MAQDSRSKSRSSSGGGLIGCGLPLALVAAIAVLVLVLRWQRQNQDEPGDQPSAQASGDSPSATDLPPPRSTENQGSRQSEPTSRQPPTPPGPQILAHEIVQRTEDGNRKLALRILLVEASSERLPGDLHLAALSRELRSDEHRSTFVYFFLPGMDTQKTPFAIAHHKPGEAMQVKRLGKWAN